MPRTLVGTALLLTLALPGAGCGGATRSADQRSQSGDEILITPAMMATSGVRTAWQAIKRHAPQIQTRERNGQPARMWRRGRGSMQLNEAPMVFVDGTRLADFRELDQIPAENIALIRILTGINGTTYYGTNAVGGVILVETKRDAGT